MTTLTHLTLTLDLNLPWAPKEHVVWSPFRYKPPTPSDRETPSAVLFHSRQSVNSALTSWLVCDRDPVQSQRPSRLGPLGDPEVGLPVSLRGSLTPNGHFHSETSAMPSKGRPVLEDDRHPQEQGSKGDPRNKKDDSGKRRHLGRILASHLRKTREAASKK